MAKVIFKNGRYHFLCPGCRTNHWFDLRTPFNYDMNSPTVGTKRWGLVTMRAKMVMKDGREVVCVGLVEKGRIKFHADSTHELAGETVDLLHWDDENINIIEQVRVTEPAT